MMIWGIPEPAKQAKGEDTASPLEPVGRGGISRDSPQRPAPAPTSTSPVSLRSQVPSSLFSPGGAKFPPTSPGAAHRARALGGGTGGGEIRQVSDCGPGPRAHAPASPGVAARARPAEFSLGLRSSFRQEDLRLD